MNLKLNYTKRRPVSNWKGKFTILILSLILGSVFSTVEAQKLKFAFLTDLHVSPNSDNETALNSIVEDINSNDYDLTVVTGDLTNTGSNAELLAVKTALDKLKIPLLIIPGNHETNWSESAGLLFNQLWGNDRFVYHKNGFKLVGFNTGPFMKMGDGHIKQEDIHWLKRTLNENEQDEIVISFSHYPLSDGLDNWPEITEILNKNNCILNFCGHGHRLALFNFDNIPGIMGRALKDKKGFGYNVVEINRDSILVYENLSDKNIQPSTISFNLASKAKLLELPVSPKPNFSVNENSKVRIDFELADTVSIFSGPCISGDSLLIYGNSVGWVKAINLKNKSILWERQFIGSIYSTPVLTAGNVVFGTVDGFIKALNINSGIEEWSVNVGSPVLSEALTEGYYIYIGGGNKAFYKIDARNGTALWNFSDIAGSIQGIPVRSGNSIVFGAWDNHLYCLDKKSGKLNWKWNNGKNQVLLSPGNIAPAIAHNKVFIVAPDRHFTALDIKTGKEIWRTNKHRVRESMGISPDGSTVYAKLMNDTIVAVATSGKIFKTIWAADAGLGYDHNPCPIVSNGNIVAGATKNGLLVAMHPRTGALAWKYKPGNSSINKLVIQNNKVWLTSTEGKIISLSYKL